MNHNLEIQKILLKVDASSRPEDKINLLKQAIHIADANNDKEWGVDLRLDLIRAEINTPNQTEGFPAFVWILDAYDNDPDLLDEDDFLWQYKWMVEYSIRNPLILPEQVDHILEDYRNRLKRNGYTDHSYYNLLVYRHVFHGRLEEAGEALSKRDETERDGMSDCIPCELGAAVELALLSNQFDEAIVKGHDLITFKSWCSEQPFCAFCDYSYYLEKAGDTRAKDFFEKAEAELSKLDKDKTSHLAQMGQLIYYLNKYDKEKAWKYFEKCAHWDLDASDAESFDFIRYMLPLFKETEGEVNLNLDVNLPYYNAGNKYIVSDMFTYYSQRADSLAGRFDSAYGGNTFRKKLEWSVS